MQTYIRKNKEIMPILIMSIIIILFIIIARERNDKNDRWPGDPNGNGNLNTIL